MIDDDDDDDDFRGKSSGVWDDSLKLYLIRDGLGGKRWELEYLCVC